MGAMFMLEMKKSLQDRGLLFWMLILPIIFTVLFIAIFTSGVSGSEKQQIIISIVPGYVVMFVFFIIISMVTSFLKDRDIGITARIASTPLSPIFYLLGKWIPYMLIVWIQIFILFLFGKVVYQIPLEQPIFLFILSIILSFTTSGLGLAMALFVKTENMGIALTQVIALGGAVLSGLWMPIDMMPEFLQSFAPFLPQYWAHQAFQEAMNGTLKYKDLFQALLILLAFGGGSFILSIIRYPNFLKQARG